MGFLNMFSSAIIMLLLISLLILVHELGHFFAAKLVGIRVDKFGFGLPFGPTLFKKKFGETEILIHAFLLGGYVSFPDDEEECDLPKDSPQRFSNKTVGQRALVISAGVICNVILAYILIFATGLIWKHLPENKFTLIFERYSPSAIQSVIDADMQKGDIIYKVNGLDVDYPTVLTKQLILSREFDGSASQELIEKKLEKLKQLNPQLSNEEKIKAGTIVKLPKFTDEEPVKMTMDNIMGLEKYKSTETKLSDAQKDLRDKINYSEEYKLENDVLLIDIAAAISDTKKPISIVVLRNNEEVALAPIYVGKDGKLGIKQSYVERYTETKNLKQLIPATFNYVNANMGLMIYSLGKLFTGKIPMSEMNGIIAVTKIGTELIAYEGLFRGLLLSALLSINLAIINILPIPALDGGHLLFLIIEKVTGRPVNKKFVEYLSNFFFYLLIALMILILYNDIHAWIIGKI